MARKSGWKIFARCAEAVAVALAAALLVFHAPSVQGYLGHKALAGVSKAMGSDISFSSVRLVPFRTLVIEDAALVGSAPYAEADTLLYARKLSATFSLKGLLEAGKEGVYLDRLSAEGLLFNYVIFDPDSCAHTGNLTHIFGVVEDKNSLPYEMPNLFNIGRVYLKDSKVRMLNLVKDSGYKYSGHGINWYDLDLDVHKARLRNMKYLGGRMSMDIDDVQATEKCGYSLRASGSMSTGYNPDAAPGGPLGLVEVTGAHITDAWSDLDIPYYAMIYEKSSDFADYLNKIDMRLSLRRSRLAMKTVAAYSGIFADSPAVLDIRRGTSSCPVNDLHVRGLELTDLYSGTSADLDFVMTNLILTDKDPEIAADVRRLDFTTKSLTELIGALAPQAGIDLTDFAKHAKARFEGSARGWITHMRTDGVFTTNYGDIIVNASTSHIDTVRDNRNAFSFDGRISLDNADLGEFMDARELGPATMTITAAGDFNKHVTRAQIDTFKIDCITALGYRYQGIRGNGYFDDGDFRANLLSTDPNANLYFNGHISTKPSRKGYYSAGGDLNIANLDLERTGLDKRGGGSILRGLIHADASLDTLGNIFGMVEGTGIRYITDETANDIGNFTLAFNDMSESESAGVSSHKMTLTSPVFGTAGYRSSTIPVTKFPAFFKDAVLCKYLPSVTQQEYSGSRDGQNFTIDVNLDDTQALLAPLKTDIYINSGTSARLSLSKSGNLSASFDSDNIRVGGIRIKGIQLSGSESGETFRLRTVGPISVNLPDMQITDAAATVSLLRDSLRLSASALSTRIESASLALDAGFYRDSSGALSVRGHMGDSDIVFDGDRWTFRKGSVDYHTSGDLYVNEMGLMFGDQTLSVDGAVSRSDPSEMQLKLDGFDLSIVNHFLDSDSKLTFGGRVDGNASYRTPLESNAGLEVFLHCPDLRIAGAGVGAVSIEANMDDEYDNRIVFKASHISPSGAEDLRIRESESSFDLNSKNLKATVLLNGLDPAILQPLLADAVSFGRGSIDGKICADYTVGQEKIDLSKSYLSLRDTLTVLPTGVRYALDADIRGDRKGVEIREINIRDFRGGSALVSGRLSRLSATLNSLEAVSDKGNTEMFSGRLFASGKVDLKAEDSKTFRLGADLTTSRSGSLKVSLGGLTRQEESMLTFVPAPESQEEEEEEENASKPKQIVIRGPEAAEGGMRLLADVNISTTPEVQLTAELDERGDNAVTIGGNGTVHASFDSQSGETVLVGDYTINEGRFKMSAAGVFSKDFDIAEGSSVKFTGDLMDTELNITASNTVRASLTPLLADTTAVATIRDVICGITVSDRLRSPKLAFSVDVPDLDPTTQSIVEGELNTEDKVQKQFLALVATGGFISGSQGGITNQLGSGLILSNLSALAAGQVTNLLRRAGIPVNVGMIYIPHSSGNDVVDVNLSTQMFGNRVVVSGSVGNRQYGATSEQDLVGDIDVEIKIDRTGRLRAKLFSHSADDYTNYLDNSQRSGVGVSYQREFNHFGDFFREVFRKQSKDGPEPTATQKTISID